MDSRNRRLDKMWELKRAKPTSETEALMMAAPNEPDAMPSNDLSEAVESALAEFLPPDRDILIMSLIGDMSIRDIATALELSKSDVHRRLGPLRDRLTELLESTPEIARYLSGPK